MDVNALWELFWDTGAPEVFLAYKQAIRELAAISA